MDSFQTEFSSFVLSKSIDDTESIWISPPKRKTMSQIIASKKNTVKNYGTSNTKSLKRNSLKRKSSFTKLDIDSKIKRLETLHEETTTSDSDTTITKIDRVSKKRKLFKPSEETSVSEDLCKTLKSINNTANQMTPLHPFNREADIKIIRYFHKSMELLAHKDDLYVYQLLEMQHHFQRSAKFLQDRFLNEILPNLYVYDCLSLEEMVIFYDRADMLVPKHVQNMIEEKVRSVTGHGISSPESRVITISDSENEETDFTKNENIKSPCPSTSSPIIMKRRNRVLQLSSSPSICSTSISENVLETVQKSDKDSGNNSPSVMPQSHVFTRRDLEKEEANIKFQRSKSSAIRSYRNNKMLKLQSPICRTSIPEKALQTVQNSPSDSCINSEVLSVMSSVNKEPNSTNVINTGDSAKHENNVKNSKTEHSDNVKRKNDLENITTNTCDTADGSSDRIPLCSCFEISKKQQVKCAKNYNKQNAKHEKLVSVTKNFTKTVQNGSFYPNQDIKSLQTIQNDRSHDNLTSHTDHSYVKFGQMIDKSLNDVSVQQVPDNTASFSSEPAGVDKECISIKIETFKAETSSRKQEIEDSVKSISKTGFVNAGTNTEVPVKINNHTQLSSLGSNNTDSISFLEDDAIELRLCGNSNIYVSNKDSVEKIAKQHKILEDCIHVTDNKNIEILQSYINYKSNINTAIKTFTDNNMKDKKTLYNLRKFVKNPSGGTFSRQNIHWLKSGKRNVLDLLTKDSTKKVRRKPARRTQQINKFFGKGQLQLRELKLQKEINKDLWSPASDPSNETVSFATSSPAYDTSTPINSNDKICTIPPSGIVIRKTYLKTDNKLKSNNQIQTASPVAEKFNKSESASISSVSIKPQIDTNVGVAMLENNSISHISDVRNDYQKRICKKPESDIQINTISPSISEKSNHSLSTVTSTSVANKTFEDSNPENVNLSIKNNFEKGIYQKLESLYPISKPDSSLITEVSNQYAASPLASKKLVYIQINKNTGNILGLRPIRTSTDKKDISNTVTSKAKSIIDNVNSELISESVNLTSTVSDPGNAINSHIDKTVSEETISSTDSSLNPYYDMKNNIFEDLPCEYDPTCSWDGGTSIQRNQNLVKKTNEMIVSTSRTIRNAAPGECTDECSVIKPTRTYTRKTARTNPPESLSSASVKTELNDSEVKLEPVDSSEDSGLEMIASQLLLGSPIAGTPCARTSPYSSASDDVSPMENSPNCILDFLVDDIKTEMEENTAKLPTTILDPIYETVPGNKEDVNITTHSFSTISEADSVWCTIKRIMSILESPIVLDDSEFPYRRVVVKTKNTQTDADITSTTCNDENDVRIKQELFEMNETIKQEWIIDSDSCDTYPEMVFDCAQIKQEISILESNTITSPYFDAENFDPVLPVQLPNENLQTHVNMSRKLKAVVAENRLSIHHLKPVTETEYATEQIIKTEYSAGTELE